MKKGTAKSASSYQKKVNRVTTTVTKYQQANDRKKNIIRKHNEFIDSLIINGAISKKLVVEYFSNRK